jgi:hypothetical protein
MFSAENFNPIKLLILATSKQKRSVVDNSNPLQQVGTLKHELDYVGLRHRCFVAEVSSLWRGVWYKSVAGKKVQVVFTYPPQMTVYSAVFAAPSRVRLAQAHGICNTTEGF